MPVNLNAQLFDDLPQHLALLQRGLYYGDALFETIRVFGGRIPLLSLHWERLLRGLELLGYAVPAHWSAAFFEDEISRIAPENARIRLTVWRSPGGLYAPSNDDPLFLITAQALESEHFEWFSEGLRLGLCNSVRLPVDGFSGIKGINAARYVAAAREARANDWDDVVLLNAYDRICETTASNLFWVKDNRVFTPPLSDGPVTGIARRLLLSLTFAELGSIVEKPATFADLERAEEVFLSNALRGIRWVKRIGTKEYNNLISRKIYNAFVKRVSEMNAP
jgi:branched-chain amino acid aminotransferase